MPYEWTEAETEGDPQTVVLWPHRSLSKRGFTIFIGITFVMILMPLIPLLGTPVLWGLLPFLLAALAAIYLFLMRSYRDGELLEEVRLTPELIEITRHNPRGPQQQWSANPYWVQLSMHPTRGPVENYITLSGEGREVELGAFLSPEERRELFGHLDDKLRAVKREP